MKKKVALMTWHHTKNFGTALQAYALYSVIKEMGYEVDVINCQREKRSLVTINKNRYVKEVFGKIFRKIGQPKSTHKVVSEGNAEKFDSFYNTFFSYTHECIINEDYYQLNDLYDVFVCGSDQIWNPRWIDERYYLNFVENDEKKIAYAPSIGVSQIYDRYHRQIMKRLINRFNKISVREWQGKKVLERLLGKRVDCVIDPVLLLSKEKWEDLMINSSINKSKIDKKYLLIFFLKYNEKCVEEAAKIAKELELEVVDISRYLNGIGDEVGPIEFLDLIYHAQYICTDSFHCMVFSTIFEKQYKVYLKYTIMDRKSENSRITSFVMQYNMIGNLLFAIKDFNYNEKWKKNAENLYLKSYRFLFDAIESVKKIEHKRDNIRVHGCVACGMCHLPGGDEAEVRYKDVNGFRIAITGIENKNRGCCLLNLESSRTQIMTDSIHAFAEELLNQKYTLIIPQKKAGEWKYRRVESLAGFNIEDGIGLSWKNEDELCEILKLYSTDDKVAIFARPCLISAIRKTNNIDSDRTLYIDLPCMGVVSNNLWKSGDLKQIERIAQRLFCLNETCYNCPFDRGSQADYKFTETNIIRKPLFYDDIMSEISKENTNFKRIINKYIKGEEVDEWSLNIHQTVSSIVSKVSK